MKIGINVNISRLLWGQIGGNTKNNSSIKTILITHTILFWGQDWGQDYLPTLVAMGSPKQDLFSFLF